MVALVSTANLAVIDAGLIGYGEAVEMQQRLCRQRQQDRVVDQLLLLEHPPVITLGQNGGLEDLLVSESALQQRSVELFETNRGGRATFHGPGQFVAYPIVKLPDTDLHAYLWKLEQSILLLLQQWGIRGEREECYPGVWVQSDKIAAVGVAVVGGVTMHGLALNVHTDLTFFDLIRPCGIRDRGVTSMQRLLGSSPSMQAVKESFVRHFCEVFNFQVINGSISE